MPITYGSHAHLGRGLFLILDLMEIRIVGEFFSIFEHDTNSLAWQVYSAKEAGKQLGISESSVRRRLTPDSPISHPVKLRGGDCS